MRVKILIFTVLLLTAISLCGNEIGEQYIKFPVPTRNELSKITNIVSIDKIEAGYVYAYGVEKQLEKLSASGYFYEILPHPGTLYEPQMTANMDRSREFEVYPTYEAYVNMMYQFAVDYPDICQVTNIGNSVNGREVLVAKISDNVNMEENEPEFFYTSTMHGDETTGYILMLDLINLLLTDYDTIPRIANIVDNIEIWINPLANPDGTYHAGNNSVFGATRFNANGVDLNRNFPCPLAGPHPDGEEWQPETIMMMDFADAHRFNMGANLHGGVEVLNYPWDAWPRLHADDEWYIYTSELYAAAAHANSPNGYMTYLNNGITNGYQWYETHGGRQDYMNYFQRSREITLELSDVKLLPENQLLDLWNYNRESLLLYLEESMYGILGKVTNQNSQALSAMITVLNHDIDNSEILTDSNNGDYHRLIKGGTYDLEFTSYGYISYVAENIAVSDGETITLDVIMESAPQFTISGSVISGTDNTPIGNVMIALVDTPIAAGITNSTGEYSISEVYQGSYSAYISSENYANIVMDIIVDENNTVFDFVLYESEIEGFESGNFEIFAWAFAGDAIWQIDSDVTYSGDFSARSGLLTHNQNSGISIDLNVTYEGELSFNYKVSSEAGYDYLKFYIDGNQEEAWSGEIDWQEKNYVISPGAHTFTWSYEKDGNVSGGSDCAWLDYISFPCTVEVGTDPVPELYPTKLNYNYPNPFNPTTTISFSLNPDNAGKTELAIYNLKGQKVRTLINSELPAGLHQTVWDGKDMNQQEVASGMYFYKINTRDFFAVKKMILMK
jgi:Zinc carboxypeptidase/FlgD Ig-like domain/Carboxypeptidase regulatory-like domain